MSCDVINYLITALLWAATTSRGMPFYADSTDDLVADISTMAQKGATSHLGTATSSTSGRVKKRGRGYRLPSQSKYIVESVYTFFEKEKQEQRSLLCNQVVKCTAMACGIGTTTVSRLHKDFQGREGLLPSPEKRYVESRVQIALDEYDVAAMKSISFMSKRSTPHLIACWVYSK